MKEIFMICNAHLDPVWLWRRDEGMAEALSTFRVAADFCEEFDGFIFNHNESVLYEWVEEYEPALFERIRKLVAEGKWRIMGGWYLQPDCVMPCGESFLRQIEVGNRYFKEKFGIVPKTAINFDPFGHTRGLVQILSKKGYENYLFMRPYFIVPEQDFIWKGYDGSEILGHCLQGGYNSLRGTVADKIQMIVESPGDRKLLCWGVGNHGGGPSKKDWYDILEYQKTHPEVKLIASGCEEYFFGVDRTKLKVYEQSMVHCMVGCYTSMVQIKQKHRMLENELLICEKMLAASEIEYEEEQLKEAEKALLFSEFHDSLPGTMIKAAENDMLRSMDYGREIISKYCIKAFFKLCEGQKKGESGEIPVLVFNPNPYRTEQEIEVEFQLEDQNYNMPEVTLVKVRTVDGSYLPTQNIKEACNLNLDWRKRIVFRASLEPMSMNRFDCELYRVSELRRPIAACEENQRHFLFQNARMEVAISKETGLLDKYCVDGMDYLRGDSAQICVFDDNEDPWKMQTDGFYHQSGVFTLLSAEEANIFNGYPGEKMTNVRVIENGAVITRIQAIFKYANSYAVVTYTLPQCDAYVDIRITMYSNDVNKMYKLAFPTLLKDGSFVGQMAFGREELPREGQEVFYQKWCGLFREEKGFAVLNAGTYGGSCKGDTIYLSLLRTPMYSAHPIETRPLSETDRCHDHIDMGKREFAYRLTTDVAYVDAAAEVYNQPVYTLSFFPSGSGKKKETALKMDNHHFILTRYWREHGETNCVRIYNSSDKAQTGSFQVGGVKRRISLQPYEFQTFVL